MEVLYSVKLCNYVISREIEDLTVVFENFSDNIGDGEDSIFLKQSQVLEKLLNNTKKNVHQMSVATLFKGLDEFEKALIEPLNINNKIIENGAYSRVLQIDYFDDRRFMEALDNELETISTQYNLRADDDYNKLYMFVSSIQLELQASDNMLENLVNKYLYYFSHSNKDCNQEGEETITIYGKKHYKIDIINKILDLYEELIAKDISQRLIKNKKTSKR